MKITSFNFKCKVRPHKHFLIDYIDMHVNGLEEWWIAKGKEMDLLLTWHPWDPQTDACIAGALILPTNDTYKWIYPIKYFFWSPPNLYKINFFKTKSATHRFTPENSKTLCFNTQNDKKKDSRVTYGRQRLSGSRAPRGAAHYLACKRLWIQNLRFLCFWHLAENCANFLLPLIDR